MEERITRLEEGVQTVHGRVTKLERRVTDVEHQVQEETRVGELVVQQVKDSFRAFRLELTSRVDKLAIDVASLLKFKEGMSVKMGLVWGLFGAAVTAGLMKLLG